MSDVNFDFERYPEMHTVAEHVKQLRRWRAENKIRKDQKITVSVAKDKCWWVTDLGWKCVEHMAKVTIDDNVPAEGSNTITFTTFLLETEHGGPPQGPYHLGPYPKAPEGWTPENIREKMGV